MRIGIVGLDSSHAREFARRIQTLHTDGKTACRVSHCWDQALSAPDQSVPTPATLHDLGIESASSLDELLGSVEGVMVLSTDGHRHLVPVISSLERGLPTFVDKPLSCSASDAWAMLKASRSARCFSASALRFADRLSESDSIRIGKLRTIEATGPFQEHSSSPGLWYYGCHTFELVDSLWHEGGGPLQVRARLLDTGHRIELEYADERLAVIGLDRTGVSPWQVRVLGTKGEAAFVADLKPAYDRLVRGLCRFFAGEIPAVGLERSVSVIEAIEASQRSLSLGGEWVCLPAPYQALTLGSIPENAAGAPQECSGRHQKNLF